MEPQFQMSQSNDFVTLTIRAPYTKVSETEIYFEDDVFIFHSKPYYLSLELPGKVVASEADTSTATASYDTDTGTYTILMQKQNPGEHFQDLDMLTKLRTSTKPEASKQPLIEVLGSDSSTLITGSLPTSLPWLESVDPPIHAHILNGYKYGFGNRYSGILSRLQVELSEVVDISDAESKSPNERRQERELQELEAFSEDHYLCDLHEDGEIQPLLEYEPQWTESYKKLLKSPNTREDIIKLTDQEFEILRKLPAKEFLLEEHQIRTIVLGLVDIIYAYAYNQRITQGENNCESGWNISKLSATLSWLETFKSLPDVMTSCIRRSLCFMLFRHWKLSQLVLQDTRKIFMLGKRQVLKCLLEVRALCIKTETKYVLNDLYITDYCVWIQHCSSELIDSLTKDFQEVNINKSDVNLDLEIWEELATTQLNESKSNGGITEEPRDRKDKHNVDEKHERKQSAESKKDVGSSSESESSSDEEESSSDSESSDSDDETPGSDTDAGIRQTQTDKPVELFIHNNENSFGEGDNNSRELDKLRVRVEQLKFEEESRIDWQAEDELDQLLSKERYSYSFKRKDNGKTDTNEYEQQGEIASKEYELEEKTAAKVNELQNITSHEVCSNDFDGIVSKVGQIKIKDMVVVDNMAHKTVAKTESVLSDRMIENKCEHDDETGKVSVSNKLEPTGNNKNGCSKEATNIEHLTRLVNEYPKLEDNKGKSLEESVLLEIEETKSHVSDRNNDTDDMKSCLRLFGRVKICNSISDRAESEVSEFGDECTDSLEHNTGALLPLIGKIRDPCLDSDDDDE